MRWKTDDDGFLKLIGKKCEAFVASDDNKEKKGQTKILLDRRKMMPVNAIHQQASISNTVVMGHGNFINSGVTLGAGSEIGSHCMINSGATIDHSAKLEDYVQIGVGAKISANVEIGEGAFIGSGAVIVAGVKIGKNARIGAGSVVIADVEDDATVFGNPAQEIKF